MGSCMIVSKRRLRRALLCLLPVLLLAWLVSRLLHGHLGKRITTDLGVLNDLLKGPARRANDKNGVQGLSSASSREHELKRVVAQLQRIQGLVKSNGLRLDINELSSVNRRVFHSVWCDSRNFTIPGLSLLFAAHALAWNQMGKESAWWSVLTSEQKGNNIPEATKKNFFDSGRWHVDTLANAMGLARKPNQSRVALDFGCGLGRLTYNLAPWFDKVACVDQSAHHLQTAALEWEARKSAVYARSGPAGPGKRGIVDFIVSTPDLLAAVKGQRYDFVHSVIALQHMAAPLQQVYLEQLCDILKPGGLGWVHLPVFISATHPTNRGSWKGTCDTEKSIRGGGMQMHFTPSPYVEQMLRARGCHATVREFSGKLESGYLSAKLNKAMVPAVALFQKGSPNEQFETFVQRVSDTFGLRAKDNPQNRYPAELRLQSWTTTPHLNNGSRSSCEAMIADAYRTLMCREGDTIALNDRCIIPMTYAEAEEYVRETDDFKKCVTCKDGRECNHTKK